MRTRPRGAASDRAAPPGDDGPAGDDELHELVRKNDPPRPDAAERVQRDEAEHGAEVHPNEDLEREPLGLAVLLVTGTPEVHRAPGDGRYVAPKGAQARRGEEGGPRHHERVGGVVREQGEAFARAGTAGGDLDEAPPKRRVVQPDDEIDHDRGGEEDGEGKPGEKLTDRQKVDRSARC